MGTFGYPLAFALAEQEGESPWEPFHVEHGFDRNASTVTIGVTNNWGSSPSPYDTPDKSGAQTALELLCKEVTKKTRLFNFPARGPDAEKVMVTMLLSPPVAKSLAQAGYSKQDVKQYVFENARMRLEDFEWVLKYTATMRTTARRASKRVFSRRNSQAHRTTGCECFRVPTSCISSCAATRTETESWSWRAATRNP